MKKSAQLYWRMLGYMRPYVGLFLIATLLTLFIVFFHTTSLWVIATLFNVLFTPDKITIVRPEFTIANINEILKFYTYQFIGSSSPTRSLQLVCALMIGAYFLKNVFAYIHKLVLQVIALGVYRDLRNQLFEYSMRLPLSYHDRTKTGNIISLIANDVGRINAAMTTTLDKVFTEPLTLIVHISLLFFISPFLTTFVFLIYPGIAFIIVRIGQSVRRRSRRMLNTFSGLLSILHEALGGIRAVKMFNMIDKETDKFKRENDLVTRNTFRSFSMNVLSSPLTEVLGVFVAGVLLLLGGNRVLSGEGALTAEDFIRYLILLIYSYEPLKKLGTVNNAIQSGLAAADRVFSFLDTPTEPIGPIYKKNAPVFKKQITFDHVYFAYPQTSDNVLTNISFSIPKGAVAALVGSSGSGKTTILDLLPRFYEVSSGAIYIDDVNIQHCDLAGLRSLFGIVSQETILFNDTIANNIAYGANNVSPNNIERVAAAANALEFIKELPKGMDTVIGEKGVTLSGGQRQRIAIARALLRNPPILILDEATSSLDTESELAVQQAIDKVMQHRTAFVVAHRLSTIKNADIIFVLENGRIAESGSHDELRSKGARYKRLYDIQFMDSNAEI